MESRLEKIFSMSLALWLGEDRKCSAAVVGLDLLLGLSMVRRCSLNRSFVPEEGWFGQPKYSTQKRSFYVVSTSAFIFFILYVTPIRSLY